MMSARFRLCLLTCLLPAPVAGARADEGRAILDRAITAHGGEDRIARTTVGHARMRGKADFPDFPPCDLTWEETFDLPGRYHRVLHVEAVGRVFRLEYAITGKTGWLRQGQAEATDVHLKEAPSVERSWQGMLAMLPLVRDEAEELTVLPERDWKGRRLVGVRATAPREGDLYFDKATGLLALSRCASPNLLPGKEVVRDLAYESYKDIDGVRYPTRLTATRDGAPLMDLTVTSIKFLDKVEDRVFAKPVGGLADAATGPPAEEPAAGPPPAFDLPPLEAAPARRPWFVGPEGLILLTLGVAAFLGGLRFVLRLRRWLSAPAGPRPEESPPGE
jgi:hypothetical protein